MRKREEERKKWRGDKEGKEDKEVVGAQCDEKLSLFMSYSVD
jgi:hypothetical protein